MYIFVEMLKKSATASESLSRLSPAELNEDGEATMEDENGRTFEIKIFLSNSN